MEDREDRSCLDHQVKLTKEILDTFTNIFDKSVPMHSAHGIKWIRRKSYRAKWLGKTVWQLVAFGCLSLRPRDILPLGRLLAGFGFDQVALGRLLWCSWRLGGSRGIGEAPPTSSMGPAGGRGRRRLADFLNPHRIANHCLSSHRLTCKERDREA